MSWPGRYRRQAHICVIHHEASGDPFYFKAAQTYLNLATEWDERKAEDSNPSAETPHRLATGRTPMGT